MRHVTLDEVLQIHEGVLRTTGGASGLRDRGGLESAVAQPQATFGGEDLYLTISAKASARAFGLVNNHPFVDGNKRTGVMATVMLLARNGYELDADMDEQEQLFLDLAAGQLSRDELTAWIEAHTVLRSA